MKKSPSSHSKPRGSANGGTVQAPVALIPDIKPEERELIRSLVRAGLTQPQVAELTGWSQQAVSKWAKGVVIDGSLPPVVEMLYQRRQLLAEKESKKSPAPPRIEPVQENNGKELEAEKKPVLDDVMAMKAAAFQQGYTNIHDWVEEFVAPNYKLLIQLRDVLPGPPKNDFMPDVVKLVKYGVRFLELQEEFNRKVASEKTPSPVAL